MMALTKIFVIAALLVSLAFEICVLVSNLNRARSEEKEFRTKVEWISSLTPEELEQHEKLCASFRKFVSKKESRECAEDCANHTD